MKFGLLDADVAKNRDLAPAAKIVYAVLRGIKNDKTGQCNPSRATIADMTGLHIKSVGRAIGQLKGQYLQVNEGNYTFEREQIVPSDGTNCSIEKEQIVPPYNNDDKNFEKRDRYFINPDSDQQQIADELLTRWDSKYSHTKILRDLVGDQIALIRLQTIHGQTRADIEQIIDANAESIKYWPRPKNLINHLGSDDDKPMIWQRLKSNAMLKSKPKPHEHVFKREVGQQYRDLCVQIDAGVRKW